MLVFISEQIELHIKYFISFQYIIQSLLKPYYYFHRIYFHRIFMHCEKFKKKTHTHLKKPPVLGQIHSEMFIAIFYSLELPWATVVKIAIICETF